MDYAALRAEGIRHLEQLSSQRWTDFNSHDPGITILEQLCYAITELGYRVHHDLPDLLAGEADPYRSLYSPRAILTTEPVTLADLRKLVVDVEGVRNAWIEPIDAPAPGLTYHEGERDLRLLDSGALAAADRYTVPVKLKGLYRVLVATSDLADIDGATVKRNVARRLSAHRPLCADFPEVRVLEPEDVLVHATVEVGPNEDTSAVLVAIYEKLAEHMAPSVRFATLAEVIASGKPMEDIFTGPRLARGFIDPAALARLTRKSALHTSDLVRDVMDVPGVRAVRELTLSSALSSDGKREPWSLALRPDRTPRFDFRMSTITPVREGRPVAIARESVIEAYIQRRRSAAASRPLTDEEQDWSKPVARDRRLSRYTSIQRQLPACYGIGDAGLPASASAERRAQAKQLKAYLLFFDQLLANTFAQLGHARRLFSFDDEPADTYAAQPVNDKGIGLEEVRLRDIDAHAAWLRETAREPTRSRSSAEREGRFLDHFMARVAEQFGGEAGALLPAGSPLGAGADKRARDKRAFLRHYPRISGARGTGFDYTAPSGEENRSGLAARVELSLGLSAEEGETFFLIEHILLRPIDEDRNQIGAEDLRPPPLLSALAARDPYSLQLSFVFPSAPGRLADPNFRKLVEQTVRLETPAHLTPYVRWVPAEAWDAVKAAYDEWTSKHRSYWTENLGL